MHTLTSDPRVSELALTIGLAANLTASNAPSTHWDALSAALEADHTPAQIADLLVGACALIVRLAPDTKPAAVL